MPITTSNTTSAIDKMTLSITKAANRIQKPA